MKNYFLITMFLITQSIAFGQVDLNNASATGSGFLVSSSGYLITNYHVIKDSTAITVSLKNSETKNAKVVRVDAKNDLAVLKIDCSECAYAHTKSSLEVKKGERVYALGYPKIQIQGLESKLTEGVISSLSGTSDDPTRFQISNPIQPGNSGGPLFTDDGYIVGVVVLKIVDLQNVNYAVKSNYYVELLNSIDDGILKKTDTKKNYKKVTDAVSDIDKATVLVLVKESPEKVETKSEQKEKKPVEKKFNIRDISKLPNCVGSDIKTWDKCFGVFSYPNGNVYQGEYVSGKREGIGYLTINARGEPNKNSIKSIKPAVYIGMFVDGDMNGQGRIVFEDGSFNEGEFRDNILIKKK